MITGREAQTKECPLRREARLDANGEYYYAHKTCLGNECPKWLMLAHKTNNIVTCAKRHRLAFFKLTAAHERIYRAIFECTQEKGKSCRECAGYKYKKANCQCPPQCRDWLCGNGVADLELVTEVFACQREHQVSHCDSCDEAYGYCGG